MPTGVVVYGIIALLILWIVLEQKLFLTTRYTISSKKLPAQLNNTRFIVLADLHNRTFGKKNNRLVRRIDALSPEFILAAGDIITKKSACYPGNAYHLMQELAGRYRIFYAYGNHEQKLEYIGKKPLSERTEEEKNLYSTWVEYKNRLAKLGVLFLDNQTTTLETKNSKLKITGVSLPGEYFIFSSHTDMAPSYLNSLLGESAKNDYQLLIAHNPIYFTDYADWGADLTLSGHLHGGMLRLPGIGGVISPQARFFPKYDTGHHTHKGRQMVVSRGLGSHSVMPRIFNIPELIHITLRKD